VAALRQRTRYRKKLIESRSSELQRLAKVLEDGGIKVGSVASTLTTVSAREMVRALIAGERDPAVLARLARDAMRKQIPELEMACDGPFTTAHGQMCRLHLDAYDHLSARVADLDQLVAEVAAPFQRLIARLVTISGTRLLAVDIARLPERRRTIERADDRVDRAGGRIHAEARTGPDSGSRRGASGGDNLFRCPAVS
jgi:hypothetical protein